MPRHRRGNRHRGGNEVGTSAAALTAFKLDIYQPIRYDEFICYYFTIMSHIDEARNNETNASFFRNRYKETAEAKKEECCIQ